jgi:hypothetical protein
MITFQLCDPEQVSLLLWDSDGDCVLLTGTLSGRYPMYHLYVVSVATCPGHKEPLDQTSVLSVSLPSLELGRVQLGLGV